MSDLPNPFNITKAVDFSDQEIKDYWVDLPGGAGFREMAKPTSPMPMLIIGGKGSGKTHLMRYFSYPLQKLRYKDVIRGVQEEKYIGIYLRSGGLNAARFMGKGQDSEKWAAIFSYYMDLWLAQLTLTIVQDALGHDRSTAVGSKVAELVADLFDEPVQWPANSFRGVLETLRSWQREIDNAVNNAAITRELSVPIRSSPGRLPFGVPQVLATEVPELSDLQFLYLIDELENLTEDQQRYVNTLVRERESPSSFKLGARLYGIRTYETYSAGETNKEGSEFETLSLDDRLRANRNYPKFARLLIARRLVEAGYFGGGAGAVKDAAARLDSLFESQKRGLFAKEETDLFVEKSEGMERPYFASLRAKLSSGVKLGNAKGLHSEADIEQVIALLRAPAYPLLEKANLHIFYQAWGARRNLMTAAEAVAADCRSSVVAEKPTGKLRTILQHFQADLLAQLYADFDQRPLYIGVDSFIEMSRGLPKNLLMILKHVVQWASFNGERPFRGQAISRRAQQKGVLEAAQWFFSDAEVFGEDAEHVQNAVRRLASLFRDVRYSDKPAECSLSTFSTNLAAITWRSRDVLNLAENWSLLIRVRRGQPDRNTKRIDAKFQLNSMLAPIWDLPTARRGALALNADEVNAIFDPSYRDGFDLLCRRRVERMTAPSFDGEAEAELEPLPLFSHD